CQHYNSVPWTF
nr:immunoglobulin light chain junction region [Macaca mulatta]